MNGRWPVAPEWLPPCWLGLEVASKRRVMTPFPSFSCRIRCCSRTRQQTSSSLAMAVPHTACCAGKLATAFCVAAQHSTLPPPHPPSPAPDLVSPRSHVEGEPTNGRAYVHEQLCAVGAPTPRQRGCCGSRSSIYAARAAAPGGPHHGRRREWLVQGPEHLRRPATWGGDTHAT